MMPMPTIARSAASSQFLTYARGRHALPSMCQPSSSVNPGRQVGRRLCSESWLSAARPGRGFQRVPCTRLRRSAHSPCLLAALNRAAASPTVTPMASATAPVSTHPPAYRAELESCVRATRASRSGASIISSESPVLTVAPRGPQRSTAAPSERNVVVSVLDATFALV
jgi:hypothetical protein